ncbi:kinetochore Sim4 complex subunit FTA2-domain-containing protein [Tricladium varicosporioides]|nr:kinetochore Sim4 complex subunit FTA2-domain-containing protein [Hymenoscyphus varicosporioides]
MVRRRQRPVRPITSARKLPPCPGPKLHAFQYRNSPIEWYERLDKDRTNQSGIEGCVFRAKIESRDYAVKVFKFFDPETTRWYWETLLGSSFPIETVVFHTDPFYAECRAYGRIKEAQIKGKLKQQVAIPCHGFLILKDQDKKLLQERGIDLGVENEFLKRTGENGFVRAIVKDLAPPDPGVDASSLSRILRDIRWLKKHKIYNRDIRVENFRSGKLVDFGSALTEPHCILDDFDKNNKEEARDTRLEDLVMFDDMVIEEGIETGIRAMPNLDYCQKLRSWERLVG